MSSEQVKKSVWLMFGAVVCLMVGTEVFALSGSGISGVATRVVSQLGAVTKLITAGAYVAGFGFGVGAIMKFKAHKDNPTQVPIGMPIALLFVAAALIFAPSFLKSAATTIYASGTQAPSGLSKLT